MAIDPSIALSVRPVQIQPQDRGQAIARAMQIQGLGNQNRLAELQFGELQRKTDQDEKLNAGYVYAMEPDGTLNQNKLFQYLGSNGLGARIPAVRKELIEADNAKLGQLEKMGALLKTSATTVLANPTLDNALNVLDQFEQQTGMKQDAQRQVLMQMGNNPDAIKRWAAGHALEADKLLPKISTQDFGGYVSDRNVDPITGKVSEVGRTDKTLTPDSILTDERTRSEGELNRGVQVRGQNLTDARGREANEIARTKQDRELGMEDEKRLRQQQGAVAQADRIINKVDQALGKVNWATAGIAEGVGSVVPGVSRMSGATDLAADLQTIKANLGFAELQAMRDASPTGGALGQVAVQELAALQSTVASLDQAQSPEQLRARLGEVRKHYENWKATVSRQNNIIPSGAAGGTVASPSKVMQDADAILGL